MQLDYDYYKCKVFRAYCIGSGGFTENVNDITDWEERKKICAEDAIKLRCLNERLNRLFSESEEEICLEKK